MSAYFTEEIKGAARARSDAIVASGIREAVRRSADHCLQSDRLEDEETALRRHSIIVDGDLGGMRRAALAAKLSISARHFTRLQHDIRQRVAVLLVSELSREKHAATVSSVHTRTQLDEAAMLAGKGSPVSAIEQLSSITATGGDACVVAAALSLQALIRQRYLGDVEGAKDALLRGKSIVATAADEPSRLVVRAQIELALAEIDIENGCYHRGVTNSTRVAQTIAQLGEAPRWLILRALSLAAYGNFVAGKRDDSLHLLRNLLSDLGALRCAPTHERIELLFWIATLLAELGRYSESSRMLASAWMLAQQCNLTLDVMRLDLLHTIVALGCGDVSTASERLLQIRDESRRLSLSSICAQAQVYLARAQTRAMKPRPSEILRGVQYVFDFNPCGTPVWIEAKVAEAFARTMLRDLQGAEHAARAADDAAATTGNCVGRGNALRELARVANAQGRKRDAKRTIMAAVDAGYKAGKPQQTAQALDLAAQICCQPMYRSEAAALRKALPLWGQSWSL